MKGTSWTYQQLQRQVAYDRLLERLYLVDEGWVLKGATALLARGLGVRGSLDIDVYRPVAREIAEADLRRAAETDIGDWFRFEVGATGQISNNAVRVPVKAMVGATTWVEFHVDLSGTDLRMTGQPEDVPPIARGVIRDADQHGYRVYPVVDHIADKVAATYERHGDRRLPSTRFHDLVDLVAIVTGASVEAQAQGRALKSEFDRRRLDLPQSFDVPDRTIWEAGYAAEARSSSLDAPRCANPRRGARSGPAFPGPYLSRNCRRIMGPATATLDAILSCIVKWPILWPGERKAWVSMERPAAERWARSDRRAHLTVAALHRLSRPLHAAGLPLVRVRNRMQLKPHDALEVRGIDCVKGQVVGNGGCGDHRIKGPRLYLAP
jgi:hypothetical protein